MKDKTKYMHDMLMAGKLTIGTVLMYGSNRLIVVNNNKGGWCTEQVDTENELVEIRNRLKSEGVL